jgi:hypothetical protein
MRKRLVTVAVMSNVFFMQPRLERKGSRDKREENEIQSGKEEINCKAKQTTTNK